MWYCHIETKMDPNAKYKQAESNKKQRWAVFQNQKSVKHANKLESSYNRTESYSLSNSGQSPVRQFNEQTQWLRWGNNQSREIQVRESKTRIPNRRQTKYSDESQAIVCNGLHINLGVFEKKSSESFD